MLPVLIRPTKARARAFLAWETAGTSPDETWQRLHGLAASAPGRTIVTGGRARAAGLRMPVLVVLAERSRTHRAAVVADRARRTLARGEVTILPGTTPPERLNDLLLDFLDTSDA